MRTNLLVVAGLAAMTGLVGCDEDDNGKDTGDGGDTGGQDTADEDVPLADHEGTGPWGVHLELLALDGPSGAEGQIQPGDTLEVTFAVTDDEGAPYDLAELQGLAFQLAGPIDHYQIVVYANDLTDTKEASVYNGDGTYTYTFAQPVPDVYHAVPNDTPDLDADQGDLGGQPLVDGTYTLASWAYTKIVREDESYWYDADNATMDVLVGAATDLETREVVAAQDCYACHGDSFYAHGGSRRDIPVCQTCHVEGGEDRYSAEDPTTTPGANIGWGTMVHKIHAGAQLAYGVAYNGYPADESLPGYPDYNTHDYSLVLFPRWPMEAATCEACHGSAADGDVFSVPSRAACGACHDAVVWETGENHLGGPQTNDDACSACHAAATVEEAHADPRTDPTLNPGLVVTVDGIEGGTGSGGQVLPGDTVTVRFSLADDAGNALTTADVASGTLVLSGPLDHMQETVKSTTILADAQADGAAYTLTVAIPDVYPPQENDTTDLGEEVGDWQGLPIVSGTYRVAVAAYTSVTTEDAVSWRVPASDTSDFLMGDATTLETRDVVDPDLCLGCHGKLEFHGMGRVGYDFCVTCHTAGAEDRYSSTDPTTTPGVTIDWGVMLHKIHGGSVLTQTYDINGYGSPYTTHNYNHIRFPRFDGGVEACDACHGASDAYTVASGRSCLSCHDSPEAAAHVADVGTDDGGVEICETCHVAGGAAPVDEAHAWP